MISHLARKEFCGFVVPTGSLSWRLCRASRLLQLWAWGLERSELTSSTTPEISPTPVYFVQHPRQQGLQLGLDPVHSGVPLDTSAGPQPTFTIYEVIKRGRPTKIKSHAMEH